MENYIKGKNIEEPLDISKIPIPNLPQDVLWMQIRGGTKLSNVLNHVMKEYENKTDIACLWTGFGPSVGKAVSCAEIMKKEFKNNLHQITKIGYRLVEEYWDPILPELDQLVVKRKLPMIHIFLSSKPLDTSETGYQAPGKFIPYFKNRNTKD
ncbi:hypothetical protein WA026_021421 [Henosepilachna vigintioctopunctata]|uniref:DNA/RNA-binding protein Alba-like domain-containing protein n=1 Tax=Henosepilachna vigintioctopunctata TaxID=420089 RepID=A0AAW1TS77_9CUCU